MTLDTIVIGSSKMKKLKTKIYQYTVILEPAEEGGYTAIVPALPGCISEGDTFEKAIKMIKQAIGLYLESLKTHDEPIPVEVYPSIATEVKVEFPAYSHKPVYAAA